MEDFLDLFTESKGQYKIKECDGNYRIQRTCMLTKKIGLFAMLKQWDSFEYLVELTVCGVFFCRPLL